MRGRLSSMLERTLSAAAFGRRHKVLMLIDTWPPIGMQHRRRATMTEGIACAAGAVHGCYAKYFGKEEVSP